MKRKILRNIIRNEAKYQKNPIWPSVYLHYAFNNYQIKKYGKIKNLINKAKGTRKRRTWKNHIQNALNYGYSD